LFAKQKVIFNTLQFKISTLSLQLELISSKFDLIGINECLSLVKEASMPRSALVGVVHHCPGAHRTGYAPPNADGKSAAHWESQSGDPAPDSA
jgi:hypothetical protein